MSLSNEYKRDTSVVRLGVSGISYSISTLVSLRGLSSLTWITLGNILTAPFLPPLSAVYPAFSIIPPLLLPPPLCFSSLSWVTSGNMVDRVDTTPPVLYIPGWLGRSVAQGGGPWTIVAGHGLCDPRERFYLFIKYLDLRNWLASMGWEVLRGYFGERGIREGWGETISKVKGKDDFDGWSKLNAGEFISLINWAPPFFICRSSFYDEI